MVRLTLGATALAVLVWLRPDIHSGRTALYQEMGTAHPSPLAVLYVFGQLGLLALCLTWALLPLVRGVGRWATAGGRNDEAEHLQRRIDAALKPRRTRLD